MGDLGGDPGLDGSHAALPDGKAISYPEFSEQLSDSNDYVWFLRLIDFYNDVCNGEEAGIRHQPVIRKGIEALGSLLLRSTRGGFIARGLIRAGRRRFTIDGTYSVLGYDRFLEFGERHPVWTRPGARYPS
jgi:hypothetical protein